MTHAPPACDPRTLKAEVLRAARGAGASAVRVASAEPDDLTRARLEAAFARGDFATWPYDAERAAVASDPATVLAGARSVVCYALAYATSPPRRRLPLSGRVSNYAWSGDYHARLRAVGRAISRVLDAAAGETVSKIACDLAPLAERAFAERSGLAWIGKHACAMTPGIGPYVFLAEVVTRLELPPDAPLRKTCGTCARCVDVCPTGALRGDYTMDASRCIADLTQRTGSVPRELRALVGDWVWGCDLCQEICPVGARGAEGDPAFAPRDEGAAFPDLQALLTLREGEFRRRYRPTAMGWRGGATLRRNAAVALGNSLDRAAVPALEGALAGDPHPTVRGHAAWALGRIGSPRALAALQRCLANEQEASVLEEARAARAGCDFSGKPTAPGGRSTSDTPRREATSP